MHKIACTSIPASTLPINHVSYPLAEEYQDYVKSSKYTLYFDLRFSTQSRTRNATAWWSRYPSVAASIKPCS
ncbi:unnamed protein product [Penicillium roqueforti FM164]|uniref:Uncharacterized protein n=1 Tax=Penicillium roqueforti (strain FM164) TaxID=1365484 RepID=W6R7P3_PENRF|nr:unnamed protein product [Penicillium roqueforti FM164]